MSASIGNIEDLLRNAAGAGWEFFDRIDPSIRERIEPQVSRQAADKRTVNQAWASFAATPEGAMAIQALLDATLFRTTFFVDLGTDPAAVTAFGFFREGQNALAMAIVKAIATGREIPDQPKPRDSQNEQISDPGADRPVVRPAGSGTGNATGAGDAAGTGRSPRSRRSRRKPAR